MPTMVNPLEERESNDHEDVKSVAAEKCRDRPDSGDFSCGHATTTVNVDEPDERGKNSRHGVRSAEAEEC